MILPPGYHDCLSDFYDDKEYAEEKHIAELLYQGYLEKEDEEYIPEELYYYLNNDYYRYDDNPYNEPFGFRIRDVDDCDDFGYYK